MNPILERTDVLIEEARVLQEASKRLEEWNQVYRVASCPLHSLPVVLVSPDGTATFMCGCKRRPAKW
jgi:hypothetical protein